MAHVNGGRQRILGTQRVVEYRAALFLIERLAGVVLDGAVAGLDRIRGELRLREPERILHERRLNGVADEGELERVVEGETQNAVEVLALGLAVIAIALGLEVHGIDHVVGHALRRRSSSAHSAAC